MVVLLRDTLLKGLRDSCCFTYNNEDQRVMQDDEKNVERNYTESYNTATCGANATLRRSIILSMLLFYNEASPSSYLDLT
jgi:hypothetical protein